MSCPERSEIDILDWMGKDDSVRNCENVYMELTKC